MFNYALTTIEQVERIFNPLCSVPFFQHETSVEATLTSGRLVNVYKVRENLLDSTAYLCYWVRVGPDTRQMECSCSWHRCTDEMCQHMATVLLYKWFELTGEARYAPVADPQGLPGLGEGPLVLRQARQISFLHFEFEEETLRGRLIELRQRYQNPTIRRHWYARRKRSNSNPSKIAE